MAIKFDVETGTVFIQNFDRGLVETLGGRIDSWGSILSNPSYSSAANGQLNTSQDCGKKIYVIDIPKANPPSVPVIFNKPMPLYADRFYPSFVITRGDVSPALDRWHSIGATQYRIPSDSASAVAVEFSNGDIVSGYTAYEQLPQAFPFDIPYTINMYSRFEYEALAMLQKVLSVFKPYSRILLKDSLCAVRSYTVFNESGFTDISEVSDITERIKAYSIEVRVEGELDLSEPETNTALLEIISRSSVL